MWERMQEQKVAPPTFNQQEMADLLAYLYTLRYVGETGDAARGDACSKAKAARHATLFEGREETSRRICPRSE